LSWTLLWRMRLPSGVMTTADIVSLSNRGVVFFLELAEAVFDRFGTLNLVEGANAGLSREVREDLDVPFDGQVKDMSVGVALFPGVGEEEEREKETDRRE
jgi:hypothetical protein